MKTNHTKDVVELFVERLNHRLHVLEEEGAPDYDIARQELIRDTLTQYHQDLMSEVVGKLEGMKRDLTCHFIEDATMCEDCQTGLAFNQALTEAQTIIKSK